MDLPIYLIPIIAATIPFSYLFITRFIVSEKQRIHTKKFKFQIHLWTNVAEQRDCICSPECLQNTKHNKLLRVLLAPITRTISVPVMAPSGAPNMIRPFQYIES